MLEEIEELDAVELGGVEAAVGSTSFGRGRTYARGKRVVRLEWDPDVDTLLGTVVGHGALYETAAYFEAGDRGRLAFTEGDCTCPIGYNCKHVAAIVVAATDSRSHRRPGLAGPRTSGTLSARARSDRVSSQPATPPELGPEAPLHPALAAPSPSWEAPLRALIGAPA
ncbi:MAG: SWIM zinc finger family protein, partial [Solirubrobacteraceae bacterium]